MERMSDIERKFAEENHNLVYSFLHSNKYNIEDFYSIAVMGYLKAVQAYIRLFQSGKQTETNNRKYYKSGCSSR